MSHAEITSSGDCITIESKTETRQYTGDQRRHTDADSMRREFSIPAYDRDRFREYKRHVFPNVLEHVWDGPPSGATRDKGGTDLLTVGKPGSGKSTWGNYLAIRLMEINDEKVVWRGSPSRSEWLPLAPWTRLCLPASVDQTVSLEPRDPTTAGYSDVDVTDLVREVVYYDDVRELNAELLEQGQFHVVYPDPEMRGLQRGYEAANEKEYEPPSGREALFHPEDPTKHWWFGWVLDRIENGPHHWTSLMLDEIGDIAPQSASKDAYATYQKVELLKDCYVDARKKGVSLFTFGHAEVDIHQLVRRKMRWRTTMNGSANPTRKSAVVGFDSVPMDLDITSSMDPGELLVWNERNFDDLSYCDLPDPISHKVKISMEGRR